MSKTVFSLLLLSLVQGTVFSQEGFKPTDALKIVGSRQLDAEVRGFVNLLSLSETDFILLSSYTNYENIFSWSSKKTTLTIGRFSGDSMKKVWEITYPLFESSEWLYEAPMTLQGNDLVLMLHTSFADNDSASLRVVKLDVATGGIRGEQHFIRSVGDISTRGDAEHYGRYKFAISPDSTQFFFYRYNYYPFLEEEKQFVYMEALRLDLARNTSKYDTMSIPLFEEIRDFRDFGEYSADSAFVNDNLSSVCIDNSGAVYQVTFAKPNLLTVHYWQPGTTTPKTLSAAFDKIDVTDRDLTYDNPCSLVDKTNGILHIAAGGRADDRETVDRFFFVTYDFTRDSITNRWTYTPPVSVVEKLIDDDELEEFVVRKIVYESNKQIILICEQYRELYYVSETPELKEHRWRREWWRYQANDIVFFAFDHDGNIRWNNAIMKKAKDEQDQLYFRYIPLDNSKARLIYYDEKPDGFLMTDLDYTTGSLTTPVLLAEVHETVRVYTEHWLIKNPNAITLLVNEGQDLELQYLLNASY